MRERREEEEGDEAVNCKMRTLRGYLKKKMEEGKAGARINALQ